MQLKILGLTVAAALVAMAMATAGPAAATAVCSANSDPCPEGQVYAGNTTLKTKTTGINVTFDTDTEDVKCPTSAWAGHALADLQGEFEDGEVASLTFNAATCKVQPANLACTALTALNLPYAYGLSAGGSGDGTMGISTGGSGVPVIEVDCGAGRLQCTFVFTKLAFEVEGGTPAIAKGSSPSSEWKGVRCPKKEAKLVAEYEVETPGSLFVIGTVSPPVLCEATPGPCAPGDTYAIGTTLKASLKANVKFTYAISGKPKEPVCTTSTLEVKTTEAGTPLMGEVTALEFAGCGGGVCSPVTGQHLPYKSEIENWIDSDNGEITWSNLSKGTPGFKLACGTIFEECFYGPTTGYFTFDMTGGATAEISWPSKVALKRESGSSLFCSETATWEGTGGGAINWKVNSPTPLYVQTES